MRKEEYQAMFDLEDRLWWYEGMRAITASIIGDRLNGIPGPSVLDVGCGTGFSLLWLRQRLTTSAAMGIDVSPDAARYWPRRGIDTAAISSARELPFRAESFDLVTCFDVVYQFAPLEAEAAVAEIRRVLKPGGFLLIREPANDWIRGSHDQAVSTSHRYNLKELGRLLAAHGLNPERATYANTLLFSVAVLHRLSSRLWRSGRSDVKPLNGMLNSVLAQILRLEARAIGRVSFPFGLSAIILAQKGLQGQ